MNNILTWLTDASCEVAGVDWAGAVDTVILCGIDVGGGLIGECAPAAVPACRAVTRGLCQSRSATVLPRQAGKTVEGVVGMCAIIVGPRGTFILIGVPRTLRTVGT